MGGHFHKYLVCFSRTLEAESPLDKSAELLSHLRRRCSLGNYTFVGQLSGVCVRHVLSGKTLYGCCVKSRFLTFFFNGCHQGHFPYPDPSQWTDEELGILPDDED